MRNEFEISVIVPVYNVENYLGICVNSILNQTQQRIEIILVDDCSTDHSLSIAMEYAEKYPGIVRVIPCEENGRQGKARNIGIEAARGRYIGFVDSDDFVDRRMYELLYNTAISTNADLVCIKRAIVPEDAVSGEKGLGVKEDIIWHPALMNLEGKDLEDKERQVLMVHETGGVYSFIYKRELIERTGTKFPEKTRYEDNFWMPFVFAHTNSIAFVQEIGYYYRQNPTSTMQTRNPSYYTERIDIENRLQEEMEARGYLPRFYDALEYLYIYRALRNTFFLFSTKFDEIPWKYFDNVRASLDCRFPQWRKCRYMSKRMRIEVFAIYYFPRMTNTALRLLKRIKGA